MLLPEKADAPKPPSDRIHVNASELESVLDNVHHAILVAAGDVLSFALVTCDMRFVCIEMFDQVRRE